MSPTDQPHPHDTGRANAADADAFSTHPLRRIEIAGYRPFRDFAADLGPLTVIIGANATGKTSLFDFLRFLRRAVENQLPQDLDWGSFGRRVFHAGAAEQRIEFALNLDMKLAALLRYEAAIMGPLGRVTVTRERLAPVPSGDDSIDRTLPGAFLDLTNATGVVKDFGTSPEGMSREWASAPNELALHRMRDRALPTLLMVRELLWRVSTYSAATLSVETLRPAEALMRQAVATEQRPTLTPDGQNLVAALLDMKLNDEEAWKEIAHCLRAVLNTNPDLKVYAGPTRGTVIGAWREEGIADDLSFMDLSNGVLRFLFWAVLCLSPRLPPILCIDEPEVGLHPRALPVLAGLFQQASARTQVLIATHSPYFLSQFRLEDIAVLRKEDGAARFVRPDSSAALRAAVAAECGNEEIALLHVSDELETLP